MLNLDHCGSFPAMYDLRSRYSVCFIFDFSLEFSFLGHIMSLTM